MVSWVWIIVTIFVTNFLTSFVFEKIDFGEFWLNVLSAIAYPFVWVGSFFYIFFRNFFVPVTKEKFERVSNLDEEKEIKKLFKNVYLWHDMQTIIPQRKYFLIRVKEN